MSSEPEHRDPVAASLGPWLNEHFGELVDVRRTIHAHPELAFDEFETTELLAHTLRNAGLPVKLLDSGAGLRCDVGTGIPLVALRADIDALAMDDETTTTYRSQVPGVAHACGHDVHTTIVLGAGLFLREFLPQGQGRVRLIFQPAEEVVPGGALKVIEEGLLRDVYAIFGLHCDPKVEVGKVGIREGAITSAADMFQLTLTGPGGHTARPERTVDLVALAGQVAAELPRRVAERTPADHPLKVVFGALHAGSASNVIPTHAVLKGTARTTDRDVWASGPEVVEAAARELIAETGAGVELDYTRGIPPVVNDDLMTAVVRNAAEALIGAESIVPTPQSAGGDDFAWYLDQVPGSFTRLGVHNPEDGQPHLDLHAGSFDVDERAIGIGIGVLAGAAVRALALSLRQ
jgi:amidohydrolase